MVKEYDIPDMSERKPGRGLGSGVRLIVTISTLELVIEYVATEQILEPDYEHKYYRFPLYRKTLKAIN